MWVSRVAHLSELLYTLKAKSSWSNNHDRKCTALIELLALCSDGRAALQSGAERRHLGGGCALRAGSVA